MTQAASSIIESLEKMIESSRRYMITQETKIQSMEMNMENLGKKAVDKVTGFKGIIIGKCTYLYGCDQYGIASEHKSGKQSETNWYDIGRVKILGKGVSPESVQVEKAGAHVNRDAPR